MRTWLKEIRENANVTQAEIALKAKISQQYYSTIENGQRGNKLPVQTAKAIAQALNFDWSLFYEQQAS